MSSVRGGRAGWLCGVLIAANAAVWGWAWFAFAGNAVLLATAFLAYTFGLRHAVDADHIAAIDNSTRKLIEAGEDARMTGLWFSLGHATVVIVASVGLALASAPLRPILARWQPVAGSLSTGFSAACLFALAIANGAILVSVFRMLAALKRATRPVEAELARLPAQRGMLGRLLRGVFRLISKSWHMYPLGFLFGLGFDTATEVGVLGVSAAQASHGLPLAAIMIFPALFTAGMALVDTADALMMAGAYRWAASEPTRKLRYNLAITLASVVVALGVGGIELLGLGAGEAPAGRFWRIAGGLNDNSAAVGLAIVALLAMSWAIPAVVARIAPGRRPFQR